MRTGSSGVGRRRRAGSKTATVFVDRMDKTQANFVDDGGRSLGQSVKAGSYPANAWGIHDMHDNVFEWSRDWERGSGSFDSEGFAEPEQDSEIADLILSI